MTSNGTLPIVAVTSCARMIEGTPGHSVYDKYVRAVAVCSGALPLVIPAMGDAIDRRTLLSRIDGIMLTGSPSNVFPEIYGKEATPEAEPHDRERDQTTLPLIREAIEAGLPLFAICRGMQELNVAYGGSLHVRIHELPGRMDHRRPPHPDPDIQHGPQHSVQLTPDGQLRQILGCRELEVNSLHWQAVDRLAPNLAVEAVAPDGTIEGIRVEGAESLALGVQWHPEYKAWEHESSRRLFEAFGDAVRERAAGRGSGPLATNNHRASA